MLRQRNRPQESGGVLRPSTPPDAEYDAEFMVSATKSGPTYDEMEKFYINLINSEPTYVGMKFYYDEMEKFYKYLKESATNSEPTYDEMGKFYKYLTNSEPTYDEMEKFYKYLKVSDTNSEPTYDEKQSYNAILKLVVLTISGRFVLSVYIVTAKFDPGKIIPTSAGEISLTSAVTLMLVESVLQLFYLEKSSPLIAKLQYFWKSWFWNKTCKIVQVTATNSEPTYADKLWSKAIAMQVQMILIFYCSRWAFLVYIVIAKFSPGKISLISDTALMQFECMLLLSKLILTERPSHIPVKLKNTSCTGWFSNNTRGILQVSATGEPIYSLLIAMYICVRMSLLLFWGIWAFSVYKVSTKHVRNLDLADLAIIFVMLCTFEWCLTKRSSLAISFVTTRYWFECFLPLLELLQYWKNTSWTDWFWNNIREILQVSATNSDKQEFYKVITKQVPMFSIFFCSGSAFLVNRQHVQKLNLAEKIITCAVGLMVLDGVLLFLHYFIKKPSPRTAKLQFICIIFGQLMFVFCSAISVGVVAPEVVGTITVVFITVVLYSGLQFK